MRNITVLVDMDGVLVDTVGGFIETWQKLFPEIPAIPHNQVHSFRLNEVYPLQHREKVNQVWETENFFYGLKPIPGALDSLKEMETLVRDISICTAPHRDSKYCLQEKWEWIRDYLGADWLNNVTIARDKTRINGTILIDDKPKIGGNHTPPWEHVLYDQPWNKTISGKRRITWQNWKEVLTELQD